jgi:predicted DsbA family dithiol-disulfide isomerase
VEEARAVGADVPRALQDQQGGGACGSPPTWRRQIRFTGTPAFVVNGVALQGAHPVENFVPVIDRHLASAGR